MRAKLLLLTTILCAPALTACANQARVELVKPPADLLACADEPTAPELAAVPWAPLEAEVTKPSPNVALVRTLLGEVRAAQRQRDTVTFGYILPLRSSWGDCSGKVAGLRAWSEGLN